VNRRSFLAAASAAGVGALAGCSVLSDGGGGGPPTDRIGVPIDWALAPAEADADLAGYLVRGVAPAAILDTDAEVTEAGVRDQLADQSLVAPQIDVDDVGRFAEIDTAGTGPVDQYAVWEGDFDADAVVEGIETVGPELSASGEQGDVTIYEFEEGGSRLGLRDGLAIERTGVLEDGLPIDDPAPGWVASVVDRAASDSSWLDDDRPGAAGAVDRLGTGHQSGITIEDPDKETDRGRSQFRGAVARGGSVVIEGEQTDLVEVIAFRDEAALEAAPIDTWLEEVRQSTGDQRFSSEVDGRFVETATTFPTAELFG